MNGFIKFPHLFILFFFSSEISVEQLEWLRNYSETIFFVLVGAFPFQTYLIFHRVFCWPRI